METKKVILPVKSDRSSSYRRLKHLIKLWNCSRLEMFAITLIPSSTMYREEQHYEGIVKIFFESKTSKCIRLSSEDRTEDIIQVCVNKFALDGYIDRNRERFSDFELCEYHADGRKRLLSGDENPLKIQIYEWAEVGRDGSFALMRRRSKFYATMMGLTKRNNKELQPFKCCTLKDHQVLLRSKQRELTRRILAMKGDGNVSTIKILSSTVFEDVPYKSVLLGESTTCKQVLKDVLEKFANTGKHINAEAYQLTLTMQVKNEQVEYPVPETACPLQLMSKYKDKCKNMNFNLKHKLSKNAHNDSELPMLQTTNNGSEPNENDKYSDTNSLSHLEHDDTVFEDDGCCYELKLKKVNEKNLKRFSNSPDKIIRLGSSIVAFGSSKTALSNLTYLGQAPTDIIVIKGRFIRPKHAIISCIDQELSLAVLDVSANVQVNRIKILSNSILKHNDIISIGNALEYQVR